VICKHRTAVGIYSTNASVERTLIEFKLGGFRVEDISVVLWSGASSRTPASGSDAESVATGTTATATLQWLLGLGAAALLTADSIIAAGPIAAMFAHTATNGRPGDLFDALVELGMRPREARYCERRVRDGGSLVSVRPSDEEWSRFAVRLLEKTGAEQLWSTDELPAADEAVTASAKERSLLRRGAKC
jgi:hypothetical protein